MGTSHSGDHVFVGDYGSVAHSYDGRPELAAASECPVMAEPDRWSSKFGVDGHAPPRVASRTKGGDMESLGRYRLAWLLTLFCCSACAPVDQRVEHETGRAVQ